MRPIVNVTADGNVVLAGKLYTDPEALWVALQSFRDRPAPTVESVDDFFARGGKVTKCLHAVPRSKITPKAINNEADFLAELGL